jgi:hypothetical protein
MNALSRSQRNEASLGPLPTTAGRSVLYNGCVSESNKSRTPQWRTYVGFWHIASLRCYAATCRLSGYSGLWRGVSPSNLWVHVLALLWQKVFSPLFFKDLLSAIRALLGRRPKDEIDDGVTYGGHSWLRRRPVDSFFSAPRLRGDDVAGRRRQSLS